MFSTMSRFVDDPVVPMSAQFPLGRPSRTPDDHAPPSPARPWGLRGMSTLPNKRTEPLPVWRYDHERQVAVDLDGVAIFELRMDPSADSVSSLDGDEGPNEDWVHDFAPDFPGPPA